MNKKKVVWYILVSVNVVLFLLLGIQYEKRIRLQQSISEKVVRFHVRANSDESYDQELKLKVRDAVGSEMAELLEDASGRDECEQIILDNMQMIETVAETVIASEGYTYEANAYLREVDFPVKTYGDYTFPAGSYEALEVVIGEGEGHNWWCVMYPNMCFSGTVYEVVDEDAKQALKEVLSEEEYEQVLAEGNYQVQFKYLTFLNELTQ